MMALQGTETLATLQAAAGAGNRHPRRLRRFRRPSRMARSAGGLPPRTFRSPLRRRHRTYGTYGTYGRCRSTWGNKIRWATEGTEAAAAKKQATGEDNSPSGNPWRTFGKRTLVREERQQ